MWLRYSSAAGDRPPNGTRTPARLDNRSMKYRPTRSCSLPSPDGRSGADDASSSRAFSIPPAASTNRRAATAKRRPSVVATSARVTWLPPLSTSRRRTVESWKTLIGRAAASSSRKRLKRDVPRWKTFVTTPCRARSNGRSEAAAQSPGSYPNGSSPATSWARRYAGARSAAVSGQPEFGTPGLGSKSSGSSGRAIQPSSPPVSYICQCSEVPPIPLARAVSSATYGCPARSPHPRRSAFRSRAVPPLSSTVTSAPVAARARAIVIPAGPQPITQRSVSIVAPSGRLRPSISTARPPRPRRGASQRHPDALGAEASHGPHHGTGDGGRNAEREPEQETDRQPAPRAAQRPHGVEPEQVEHGPRGSGVPSAERTVRPA